MRSRLTPAILAAIAVAAFAVAFAIGRGGREPASAGSTPPAASPKPAAFHVVASAPAIPRGPAKTAVPGLRPKPKPKPRTNTTGGDTTGATTTGGNTTGGNTTGGNTTGGNTTGGNGTTPPAKKKPPPDPDPQ